MARLDYGAALGTARAVLAKGTALPDELFELQVLVAELAAATGDETLARRSFGAVLSLRPDYVPAAGTSPRVRVPFEQAQRELGGKALAVSVRSEPLGEAGGVQTEVSVSGDVFELVQGARLYRSEAGRFSPVAMSDSPSTSTTDARGAAARWACEAAPCPYFVALVDSQGNELRRVGSPYLPLRVEGVRGVSAPVASRWRRPGVWLAGGSALLAGAAVYFGVRFAADDRALARIEADPASARYAEAQSLDETRRRNYALMLVGSGLALGAGGAAALTW